MADISDTFNRADGALGSDWTLASGSADVSTNRFRVVSTGFASVIAIHNTSVGGSDQYIKCVFATNTNQAYPVVVLRYTDSGSPFYLFDINGNDGDFVWIRHASVGGATTTITSSTALGAFGSGDDSFGLTIEGTGTATTVRGWKNPTGDTPTSTSVWGGSGPGFTFTTDPASPVDSGNLVGIGGGQNAQNIFFDTFFAGNFGATQSQAPRSMHVNRMRA